MYLRPHVYLYLELIIWIHSERLCVLVADGDKLQLFSEIYAGDLLGGAFVAEVEFQGGLPPLHGDGSDTSDFKFGVIVDKKFVCQEALQVQGISTCVITVQIRSVKLAVIRIGMGEVYLRLGLIGVREEGLCIRMFLTVILSAIGGSS